MQRRAVWIVLALLGLSLASAANAASVVLSASSPGAPPNTALYGEIITLTVSVTVGAGPNDLTDTSVFGVIQYQNAVVVPVPSSQVQYPLPPTSGGPWGQGNLTACTTINCRAFSQNNPGGSVSFTNFVIATMQFSAVGPIGGVASFNWQTTPVFQRLDFFGVTSAPGVTVTVVPEPTTAALLGVVLLGLAFARRRTQIA